jgi:hypothetical protein
VDRRRRAGQVVDLVHLDIEGEGHVVPHHLEQAMVAQVFDVPLGAGEVVVDAQDFVARLQQALAQVGADEAGAARDQDLLGVGVVGARRQGLSPCRRLRRRSRRRRGVVEPPQLSRVAGPRRNGLENR